MKTKIEDWIEKMKSHNMSYKKIVFSVAALIMFLCVGCVQKTTHPGIDKYSVLIVGEWEGADDTGKEGIFIFKKDGRVDFVLDGKTFNDFAEGDPDIYLKYELDTSFQPMHLDFVMSSNQIGFSQAIKMIIEFINEDEIRVASNFNDTRPVRFPKTGEDTMYLKRVKN